MQSLSPQEPAKPAPAAGPSAKDREGPDLLPTLSPDAIRHVMRFLDARLVFRLQRLNTWWRRNLVPWLARDASWWLSIILPHYSGRECCRPDFRGMYYTNIPDGLLPNFVVPSVRWLVLGNSIDPCAAWREIELVRPVLPFVETLYINYISMADLGSLLRSTTRLQRLYLRNTNIGVPRHPLPFFIPPMLRTLCVNGVTTPISSEFKTTRDERIAREAAQLVIESTRLECLVALAWTLSAPMTARIIGANARLHTLLLSDDLCDTQGYIDVDFEPCPNLRRVCLMGAFASRHNVVNLRRNHRGLTDLFVTVDFGRVFDLAAIEEYARLAVDSDSLSTLVRAQPKLRTLGFTIHGPQPTLVDAIAEGCPLLETLLAQCRPAPGAVAEDERVLALIKACPRLSKFCAPWLIFSESTSNELHRTRHATCVEFLQVAIGHEGVYFSDRRVRNAQMVRFGPIESAWATTVRIFDLDPGQFKHGQYMKKGLNAYGVFVPNHRRR